jgi:hypothetical protein
MRHLRLEDLKVSLSNREVRESLRRRAPYSAGTPAPPWNSSRYGRAVGGSSRRR